MGTPVRSNQASLIRILPTKALITLIIFVILWDRHCDARNLNQGQINTTRISATNSSNGLLRRNVESEMDCPLAVSAFFMTVKAVVSSSSHSILGIYAHLYGVKFFLSTRRDSSNFQQLQKEDFVSEYSDFIIDRPTIFIVGGYTSGMDEWAIEMKNALLKWEDANVVVVHWGRLSGSLTDLYDYTAATANTERVGEEIARLLRYIVDSKLDWDEDSEEAAHAKGKKTLWDKWGSLHLIGFSLGSHIVAMAAKLYNRERSPWTISRLTGLDPAAPCFEGTKLGFNIAKDEAEFVDVVHTDIKPFGRFGLGIPHALGDNDFYPNDGEHQKKCRMGFYGHMLNLAIGSTASVKHEVEESICSHSQAYELFIESIVSAANGGCKFSSDGFVMGILSDKFKRNGEIHFQTNAKSPYCMQ